MQETYGDIWNYWKVGNPICITTNGTINAKGELVMGRGIALQAKTKFPGLALWLGNKVKQCGNRVLYIPQYNMYTFPVKHNWFEVADINLIEQSARVLNLLADESETTYLVRPGCGNGQLSWNKVRLVLEPILDSRFVIVERS